MQYREAKGGAPRSITYRGTVESLDDPQIATLRKAVAEHNSNKWEKQKYYVRIRGRGGSPHLTGLFQQAYERKLEDSTHFDVYVQPR